MVKYKYLKRMLETMPELNKVVNNLTMKKFIVKTNIGYSLNINELIKSDYINYLEISAKITTFEALLKNIKDLWKGKIGVTKDNYRYLLFDSVKTTYELNKFVEEHKDVSFDLIVKANKEFLQNIEKTKEGFLRYSPKCSNFIKNYLIEYVTNLKSRKIEQEKIGSFNNLDYGSFTKDL